MKKVLFQLYVSDFEKAVDFFEKIDICKVFVDRENFSGKEAKINFDDAVNFTLLVVEAKSEDELKMVGKQAPQGKWLLYIPVDNIESVHKNLVKKGFFLPDISHYPWASVVPLLDPFGNSYILAQDYLSH